MTYIAIVASVVLGVLLLCVTLALARGWGWLGEIKEWCMCGKGEVSAVTKNAARQFNLSGFVGSVNTPLYTHMPGFMSS